MSSFKVMLSAALVTCAAGSHADVTVTMLTEGKASFINVGGESVVQTKGQRQRTTRRLASGP
jgi:hypothetical protein